MQTTLLTVAIAIILAVVAALVGPLLIDWNGYRSIFETQASHVIGAPVRVGGAVDLRLLPSPRLTLNDIQIGAADGKPATETVKARSLGIEFALAPLLRNEWRATELNIAGPRVNLTADDTGQVRTPGLSFAFNPEDITIDKLSIEDGVLTVTQADGATLSLERVWFNGEARSLLGPVKGEGAATIGGELYPFRLSSGRYADDGTLKVRVNVDPVNRPLSIETDGVLTLSGTPQFEGTLKLAKPVGIAPKGPAARAELRTGDVILAVKGEKISDSAQFYRKLWALGDAGVDVPMTLYREGDTFDVVVTSTDRAKMLRKPKLH